MRPPRWILNPLRAEWLIRAVDRVALRAKPGTGSAHVLIAPPGGGNIGDQALVEAFVEATSNPVVVVVRQRGDILVPEHLRDRMRLLALPALVYGSAVGHLRDVRRLNRELSDAGSFNVVGADIMDGAYVPRASVNRAALAQRLARLGWSTRILGFSWNAAPRDSARRAVASAGAAGVRLLLRDPVSAERARGDGLPVTDAADLVFLATTRDDSAVTRYVSELRPEQSLALVNASGLVGDDSQAKDYVRVIRHLRSRDHRVVIVPHVSRPGADDLPLCRVIAAEIDDPDVSLIERLVSPGEIRGLAARADIVVTGRMHLAVMSLMAGTPPITVSTQGKVEGLMTLFDRPELCVAPGEGFADRVIAIVDGILDAGDPLRSALLRRMPVVKDLASENMAGLVEARESEFVA
jgi:colanic acid/amylovoran biosynthesis protein